MPSLEARLVKAELHLLPVSARRDDGTFDRIRDSCMSSPLAARGTKGVEPCEFLLDVLLEGGLGWPAAEFRSRFPRTASILEAGLEEAGIDWADVPVRKPRSGPLRFDPGAARARLKAKQQALARREAGVPWKTIIRAVNTVARAAAKAATLQ